MIARDPLTERYPRTLRETVRDPYDWWEGGSECPLLFERTPAHRFDAAVMCALGVVLVLLAVGAVALLA